MITRVHFLIENNKMEMLTIKPSRFDNIKDAVEDEKTMYDEFLFTNEKVEVDGNVIKVTGDNIQHVTIFIGGKNEND